MTGADGREIPEGAKRHTGSASLSLRAQKTEGDVKRGSNEGDKGGADEEGLAGGPRSRVADGGPPDGRQLSSQNVSQEAFRMPAAVGNGVGWGWDRGPFGASPECPSSPRVLQIGIAMDTGYFKVCALPW